MIISYPRPVPPILAVWPPASPGMTLYDGIDLTTWLNDNAPAGDLVNHATAVASPGDLTMSSVTITGGKILALRHTGLVDGTTYIVMLAITTVSGISTMFPVALTVSLPGSAIIPPSGVAALNALFLSLPTTLPGTPNVLWLDDGIPAIS